MPARIRSFPIVGHRGAPQLAPPGNTVASLHKAIEVGADMLEVDVRCTRDNVLVLEHEAVRLIDGRETPLRDRTFADWHNYTRHTPAPIATLDNAFAIAAQAGAGLMLDVKEPGYEALLARAIRQSGFPMESLLVAGAGTTSRTILRGLDPRIPLSLTLDAGDAARVNAKLLADVDTDAVTWHYRLLTPAIVQVLHRREIVVYAWTVSLSEEMRRMRDDCRVDGIITDAPDLLRVL